MRTTSAPSGRSRRHRRLAWTHAPSLFLFIQEGTNKDSNKDSTRRSPPATGAPISENLTASQTLASAFLENGHGYRPPVPQLSGGPSNAFSPLTTDPQTSPATGLQTGLNGPKQDLGPVNFRDIPAETNSYLLHPTESVGRTGPFSSNFKQDYRRTWYHPDPAASAAVNSGATGVEELGSAVKSALSQVSVKYPYLFMQCGPHNLKGHTHTETSRTSKSRGSTSGAVTGPTRSQRPRPRTMPYPPAKGKGRDLSNYQPESQDQRAIQLSNYQYQGMTDGMNLTIPQSVETRAALDPTYGWYAASDEREPCPSANGDLTLWAN